ncbi:hypothetical protein AX16_001250 [Volvariella volvacea WC 439]|nr:hypothetical protein AX16_001250 [Volvariella volvacea WC 439]
MSEPFIMQTYTLLLFINALVNDPIKVHTTTPSNKLLTPHTFLVYPYPPDYPKPVTSQGQSRDYLPIGRKHPTRLIAAKRNRRQRMVASTIDGYTRWLSTHNVKYDSTWWAPANFMTHMTTVVYPEYVLTEDALHIVQGILSWRPKGVKDFERWCKSIGARLEQGDRYQFKNNLSTFATLWHSLTNKFERGEPEAALRLALDVQGFIAFEQCAAADKQWRSEPLLSLPWGSESPDCVRVDAIVTATVPSDLQSLIPDGPVGSWGNTKTARSELPSVVVFIMEAKDSMRDDQVLRQLQMSFYSAHLHRKRLAMESGPIFGATLIGTNVRLYVSHMVDKDLIVQPIRGFYRLACFNEYLRLYFDLCRISEYQTRWLEEEFERWRGDQTIQGQKIDTMAAREGFYSESNNGAEHGEESLDIEMANGEHDRGVVGDQGVEGDWIPGDWDILTTENVHLLDADEQEYSTPVLEWQASLESDLNASVESTDDAVEDGDQAPDSHDDTIVVGSVECFEALIRGMDLHSVSDKQTGLVIVQDVSACSN